MLLEGAERRPLVIRRQCELEDSRRRNDERKGATEAEGRHVALDEGQPGRDLRWRRGTPVLGEAKHWRRPVDSDRLEARGRKRAGHPPCPAADLEDGSTSLGGETEEPFDVALGRTPDPDGGPQDVVDLRAEAVRVDARDAHSRMLDRLTCDHLVT